MISDVPLDGAVVKSLPGCDRLGVEVAGDLNQRNYISITLFKNIEVETIIIISFPINLPDAS